MLKIKKIVIQFQLCEEFNWIHFEEVKCLICDLCKWHRVKRRNFWLKKKGEELRSVWIKIKIKPEQKKYLQV
ncbi:hypothetical protein CHUAL_012120 [Chamberlinius hualienensis]